MRIAALQPSVSITLDRLGCLDSLVACTRWCLEAVPALRKQAEASKIAVIRDSWSSTTEEIQATRPDLVMASVPYRMESLAAILKSGLPVLALAPHSLENIYSDIRLIGSVVGARDSAQVTIAEMQREIASVRDRAATSTPPLVYCEEWGKPLIHSQSWVRELVEAAGGRFMGEPGAATTTQNVAVADPDIIVMAWCGAGDRVPLERVVSQRGWLGLKAVREARVYCIPDEYLNTPAPTLIHGLHMLAAAIDPRKFNSMNSPRTLALRLISGLHSLNC